MQGHPATRLLANLGGNPQRWFMRYRDPHDLDHLRLRIRVTGFEEYGTCSAAVGAWASHPFGKRL